MTERLVEQEIIGYGPGSNFASVLANLPLKPRNVKIFFELASSTVQGIDDGTGMIVDVSGANVTGTVNYSTGQISVSCGTALIDSSHRAFVSYVFLENGVTDLNRVQYVQEDFQTFVSGIMSFIQNNFPDSYNDYASSSMGMALVDINAYVGQALAWYLNRKVTDLYMSTARSPNAVAKVARTLGYKPSGATGSIVPLTLTLKSGPYTFPVPMTAPFAFQGPNNLRFEYRGFVPIVWAPGESTKQVDLQEGVSTVENFVSNGQTNQIFKLLKVGSGKFVAAGSIQVFVNGVQWTEYPVIPFDNVKAFESNIISSPALIKFGDGIQGLIPANAAGIQVKYVAVSGFGGRIVSNTITAPIVPLSANFTDIPLTIVQTVGSAGGDDPEDLRSITVNAPLFQKTQDRAITAQDYNYLASTFPNVANADAQIVRGVSTDQNLLGFFSAAAQIVIALRTADRYLAPRPQVQSISFSTSLFDQNVVSIEVDGFAISVAYATNNDTTLKALAGAIAARPNVASAVVRTATAGNEIFITSATGRQVALSNLSITGGISPLMTVTQLAPAPSQIQVVSLDRDPFSGNVLSLTYGGTAVSVSFASSASATINALGNALASFAVAPVVKIKETATAPHQVTTISFDKPFFSGNLIKVLVKDMSQPTPVNTSLNVGFLTSATLTLSNLAAALGGLSFVSNATADSVNNVVTVTSNSLSKKDLEIVGPGPGTGSGPYTFTTVLSHLPIVPGTISVFGPVSSGSSNATDDGIGNLSGTNVSGTINYLTGHLTLSFTNPILVNGNVTASYFWYDANKSLEFTSIEVTNNTVTVDTTARTVTVATDGPGSVALAAPAVATEAPASAAIVETQSLISADLGSVAGYATQLETASAALTKYLNDTYTDGCRANTVQVMVLAKDAQRKYVAPPQILLDQLKAFLDARRDIVHTVVCVSGFSQVIEANLLIEVLVSANAVQADVVNTIRNVLLKSDAQPYGLMVGRSFGDSLYVSDIFGAIEAKLEKGVNYDYLNVLIQGPLLNDSNFVDGQVLSTGRSQSSLSVVTKLQSSPVVPSHLSLKIADAVTIATDDGVGNLVAVVGSGYTVSGTINYQTGALKTIVTPDLPVGQPLTASFYKSLIDARGNLICPAGYVLQYGTVKINALPRLS